MSNKPTHIAYVVTQSKNDLDKPICHEVGAVWTHQKGNGFDLIIHEQISVSGGSCVWKQASRAFGQLTGSDQARRQKRRALWLQRLEGAPLSLPPMHPYDFT